MSTPTFLGSRDDGRPLTGAYPEGFTPVALFLGPGAMGLEVAYFECVHQPGPGRIRALHEVRQGRRATPVVVAVTYGTDRAAIVTRFGDEWSLHPDLSREQAERLCQAALDAPDRHAADALLRAKLQQLALPIPGLRNAGLFAMHELEHGVPKRPDWGAAESSGRKLLDLRGHELVQGLGYSIEALPGPASILRAAGTRLAVAVFLDRQDEVEPASERFDGLSPVSYALAKADAERLDYVVVTAASLLRVYPVRPSVGTARRGRTETFVELDLALLEGPSAGYLLLLASAAALAPAGTFSQILEASRRFAADLGSRLRDRVYADVMPRLCRAIVAARRLRNPSRDTLQEVLEMGLLTLFRLLFVAYAEDKELLPYHTSETYRAHSLKQKALRLVNEAAEGVEYGSGDFYWTEVTQLWKAVDQGNPAWRVPAYNGGLFASGAGSSPAAQRLAGLSLSDDVFVPALKALLLDATDEQVLGPVDFRALGVREFGTIYEGLLEQELAVASTDLTVDAKGMYLPVQAVGRRSGRRGKKASTEVVVAEGEVYLHDRSGARKASGAYYTKDFAVEHLIEGALDPALRAHLARLDATYDAREAADHFFDFHVADIAMGSGHFLVAAVDHIERGLSGYLARRSLPSVRNELDRLRKAAVDALGDEWRGDPIEDTQLLRRQIARRCIHGVDVNPLAVELARLSLWIHTFVPGLPLSFLDANLVVGNSLVGIATFDEAREVLGAEAQDLFSFSADELIASARGPVSRLARLHEATAAEVRDARKLYEQARQAVGPTADLFTVLTASRIDEEVRAAVESRQVTTGLRAGDLFADRMLRRSDRALKGLRPLHFPTAFPQVFDRPRGGFDVILGNPPWQEATLEEHAFWARYSPGLRGLEQRLQEQEKARLRRERPDLVELYDEEKGEAGRLREVLTSGPFPGMGTGDPDLYKAFCWRFWSLLAADGGRMGVVLPRSAFAAKGSTEFRIELFRRARLMDLTMLTNTSGWVFDEAEFRYTIALAIIERCRKSHGDAAEVVLDGPYTSLQGYRAGRDRVAERPVFKGTEPATWNDTASLPLLPGPDSVSVFLKLRRAPRLDLDDAASWRARPYAELHATNDKKLMDLETARCPRGHWPVYKGESFDIWTPDTGSYYGWADADEVVEELQQRRERAGSREASPFGEFTAAWLRNRRTLPCHGARIAFRDVTNRTNQRTVIASLVPPKVVLTNSAPFLLWPRGDTSDQAFLLGLLCSIPLDWYARRFVETHVNYFVFNPLPVPRPPRTSALWSRVVSIAGRLAVGEEARLEEWGTALGVVPESIEDDERSNLIAELDALAGHLYGLDERDIVHIFSTFHEGWDFGPRLEAVLSHFRVWGRKGTA